MMAEQSWLQSLGLDTILRALVPIGSAAAAAWGAWKWGAERADKKEEEAETRQEKVQRELDAQQALMSKQGQEALAWVRDEAERYRKRVIDVEAERDNAYQSADAAWDISRAWKERAHQLRHDLLNAQTAVNSALILRGDPPREWPDEALPLLDEIVADNAKRAAERRAAHGPQPSGKPSS